MAEITQAQDKRMTFIDTLVDLADSDPTICFIIPDVGWNYAEKFQHKFPNRFINTGVTEQFATIFATTLALDGWKPYLYTMINFVLFRNYEMVRNGIVCHNANVKLLGVKGSSGYCFLGFSHNLLHEEEDIKLCENIGLRSFVPETNDDVKDVILSTYADNKSAYIRL
ncbi:MAG: hypothetical protein AAB840_02640 [Patescibacteria group bacterium]